jgi:hypothetical protein
MSGRNEDRRTKEESKGVIPEKYRSLVRTED